MPIAPSDLNLYGSASMPSDDSSTAGGALSLSTRVVLTDLPAAATVRAVSSSAADTGQSYVVSGTNPDGSPVTETLTLTGETPVVGSQSFGRVRKINKSSGAALAGTATFYRSSAASVDADSLAGQAVLAVDDTSLFAVGTSVIIAAAVPTRRQVATIASVQAGVSITLTENLAVTHTAAQADAVPCPVVAELPGAADAPAGQEVTLIKKVFESAATNVSATETFYEKVFARNDHSSLALTAGRVRLADTPTRGSPTTTVDADSARGGTVLFVASTSGFTVGDVIAIGTGTARAETATVSAIDAGVSLSLAGGLTFDHTAAQADGVRIAKLAFGVAPSLDDSGSVANRKTAPSGVSFGGGTAAVVGSTMAAGTAQGIWLRLTLPASDTATRATVVLEHSGQSL